MTQIEEARTELSGFMKQASISLKQIADECGLSTTVISQFLNGTYTGNNSNVADIVTKYLVMARKRLLYKETTHFYPKLENTKKVLGAVEYAHKSSDMILIRGESGAGKTTALKYYAEQNPGVHYLTANAAIRSASAILRKIAELIGKTVSKSTSQALMELLIPYFYNTHRLIIIDEADHLTLNALQAIRNLNDEAGVGIVLAGNDKLYRQMLDGTRNYEFDQIRTRIFLKPRIGNDYSEEDLSHIFSTDDKKLIASMTRFARTDSLREAVKLYDFCAEHALLLNTKLDYSFVKSAYEELRNDDSIV